MKILHGEHEVHIHQDLVRQIQAAIKQNQEVFRIQAKDCTLANLELLLGEQNLFQQQKLVVIGHLHSLAKSAKKTALLEYIHTHQNTNLILLEKKQLTASQLKKFPHAKVFHFPMSSTLFQWLDCLGNSQAKKQALLYLQKAKVNDGVGFCFAMLARQTRLLLLAKSGGTLPTPIFVQTKLRRQSQRFSLEKLLQLHQQLLKYDYQSKTSDTALSLEQQLDLLTLSL